MARPEKWKPEFLETARRAASLGLTDREIAELLGVAERTLNYWKFTKEGLQEALAVGKEASDARVVQSLYRRATGYSYDAKEVFCSHGVITEVSVVKHVPPDTTAMIFWLKNRDKENWRDRHETTLEAGRSLEELIRLSYLPPALALPEPEEEPR